MWGPRLEAKTRGTFTLRRLKGLHGYTLLARDGEIGQLHDVCFHDGSWRIHDLVVTTGSWLGGRNVRIAPAAVGKPNWAAFTFPVALTREQLGSGNGSAERGAPRQEM